MDELDLSHGATASELAGAADHTDPQRETSPLFYQLLVRTPQGWQPRGALDSSHALVIERLRGAAREGELVLLSSRTPVDLAAMAERVQRGLVRQVVGVPLPACPEDLRRWEIEAGPGGDRDQPYRFQLAVPWRVTRRWIALMRRHAGEHLA